MNAHKTVGLIVNPVAGIGGSVGLAGSDGVEIQAEALARGGVARAPGRAERFVTELHRRMPGVRVLTAPGPLGGDAAPSAQLLTFSTEAVAEGADQAALLPAEEPVLDTFQKRGTSAADTVRLTAALALVGVSIIVFVGGDGTARDVLRGLALCGVDQLCVGVPGGVKMHSGVFAVTPEDAAAQVAEVLHAEVTGREVRSEFRDVADLNEAARRRGELHTDVYGAMRVPLHARMQRGKRSPMQGAASVDGAGISSRIRSLHEGAFVFGPGTTVAEVAYHFGIDEPSLLGFDVVLPGGEVLRDVTGATLEGLCEEHELAIVLSPIGGQGFVIGRGNHQLTEGVLERLDPEKLVIVSGSEKLGELAGKLRIDAPTLALNDRFGGYRRVLLGPVDDALVYLE